jgi:hypothetical protein
VPRAAGEEEGGGVRHEYVEMSDYKVRSRNQNAADDAKQDSE